MEVYVVYGRTYWCEGVYDHEGNYFRESPIIEAYQSFDTALAKMKEYVKEAYNYLKKCNYIVDKSFSDKTTEDDLFKCYNMDDEYLFDDEIDDDEVEEEDSADEEITNDVCWYYDEGEDYAEWQMLIKNFEPDFGLTFMFPNFHETVPILAGLGVRKVELNA